MLLGFDPRRLCLPVVSETVNVIVAIKAQTFAWSYIHTIADTCRYSKPFESISKHLAQKVLDWFLTTAFELGCS